MYCTTKDEFLKLSTKGNLIPVYKEVLGDLDTPVSAYFKLAKKAKYSFLLESVEGEEKIARYSFLAKNPEIILKTRGDNVEIVYRKNGRFTKEKTKVKETPLEFVRQIMADYKLAETPNLPRFCGGMVGFISYDTVRYFERLPNKPKDDLKLPDVYLVLSKDLIIFDHLNHNIKIVSCAHFKKTDSQSTKLKAYNTAINTINQLDKELSKSLSIPKSNTKKQSKLKVRSNMTEAKYKSIVKQAKKDIRDGEIIQAVLSQRFAVDINTDPFNIYRSLRALNPSPYMYYLKFNKVQIVGSSPELLVRCENKLVETRPIAGTRPRGKSEKEDAVFAKDLLNDPKEIAEHIMLVDLGRNDLGRVCDKGTVSVSEFMCIEKYSHVMHIVSNVQGKLRNRMDSLDVLQSAFPAGTLSGAPKIRAMEIIDELENISRGPYGGCIGYFSFSGNLDTCITIRTIVVKGKTAYIQAGAGIVADSNPGREYQETINKAKAQIMAIEVAHNLNM